MEEYALQSDSKLVQINSLQFSEKLQSKSKRTVIENMNI